MKKITSLALATLFSTTTLLASSNVQAMGISWQQSGHSYQTVTNPFDWLFGNNNRRRSDGVSRRDVPAPIPGLLALAVAVGGGVAIRRKARKNKSDKE
jgi:hypothetical protein